MRKEDINHMAIASMVLGAARKWMASPEWEAISKMSQNTIAEASRFVVDRFYEKLKVVPHLAEISNGPAFTLYLIYVCSRLLIVLVQNNLDVRDLRNIDVGTLDFKQEAKGEGK